MSNDTFEELEKLRAAQQVEYGTWVATEQITHLGALAYHEGDPVPVSNVERYGYDKQGLVKKRAAAKTPATDSTKG